MSTQPAGKPGTPASKSLRPRRDNASTDDIAIFSRNVAEARAQRKLLQAQVSARSGIHVTEISRIERGLRDPRISTLIRLARALNVRPARLLDGINKRQGRSGVDS
jgi:transcriptional regulator with XRE-family HTH domain